MMMGCSWMDSMWSCKRTRYDRECSEGMETERKKEGTTVRKGCEANLFVRCH